MRRPENLLKIFHLFLKLLSNFKTKWEIFSNSCGLLRISELYVSAPIILLCSVAGLKLCVLFISMESFSSAKHPSPPQGNLYVTLNRRCVLKSQCTISSHLVVFISIWRFSFISIQRQFENKNNLKAAFKTNFLKKP